MVADAREEIEADLDREITPLREQLVLAETRRQRWRLRRQIHKAERRARRRLRTAVW